MAGDLYFHDVVLLLHADGTDASTTITDSSDSGHAVTANGNAQLDTAQKQFGTASALFDGAGDYLSVPDSANWSFGTGDYTVECWVRFAALPSSGAVFSLVNQYESSGNQRSWTFHVINESGTIKLRFVTSTDGAAVAIDKKETWSPSTDTWYHVAGCRANGSLRIFVDGSQLGTATTDAGNYYASTSALFIGAVVPSSPASFLNGWLDDIRITKGVARYTATFTKPSAAFPDYREVPGTGALASAAAAIAGTGTAISFLTGTGALGAQPATIAGAGRAFTTLTGTGALAAQSASIAGTGSLPMRSCFYAYYAWHEGADYLSRAMGEDPSGTRWTFATRLFISPNAVPDYDMVCLWRSGNAPGAPADEVAICLGDGTTDLGLYIYDGANYLCDVFTDDPLTRGVWHDVTVHYDSAQATAANRVRIYVDAVEPAMWSGSTYPDQNTDAWSVLTTPYIVVNGYGMDGTGTYIGPMAYADTLFISGRIAPPESCHDYIGTYGTADWHLRYLTSSVGADITGNGYDFTEAGAGMWIEPVDLLCLQMTFPVEMFTAVPVYLGLPITIRPTTALSPITLPISVGAYPKTVTLPIAFRVYQAKTVTLPITIRGAYMTAAQAQALLDKAIADIQDGGDTEAIITQLLSDIAPAGTEVVAAVQAALDTYIADPDDDVAVEDLEAVKALKPDFVRWKAYVELDSTDISTRLYGPIDIEFEEMAAAICTLSFIPEDGVLDALAWVGKTLTVRWQELDRLNNVVYDYPAFTGIVSDPTWDVESRTVTLSATSDLQQILDRMSKTDIDTLLTEAGATYSDVIFGDPADLSGWDYCEAKISTTTWFVWQDASGALRVSDTQSYSYEMDFNDDARLDGTTTISYASRVDMLNRVRITLGYRFKRKRSREVYVSWHPWQLTTPSTYLSGNEGGWELCQRSMIESAAESGGWSVIGEISYTDVWPSGSYPSYSDSGTPISIGWNNQPEITDEFCIGANWIAGRRWMQTVTERFVLQVDAPQSQGAIGIMATDESYGYESEYDDQDWEGSLEFEEYSTTGMTRMDSGDYRLDLDDDRATFETAQEVALAKARCDILRSHRGTTVEFDATFNPLVDLTYSGSILNQYINCAGKIRRLAHHWDSDTGQAEMRVSLALRRHNGSGIVSDTPLEPLDKLEDPDETVITSNVIQAKMYIGGQIDKQTYEEDWIGYLVNLPFNSTYGGNTLLGSWGRNPENTATRGKIYEEGFHMKYPDIDSEYADPHSGDADAIYEVSITQDGLTLTAG